MMAKEPPWRFGRVVSQTESSRELMDELEYKMRRPYQHMRFVSKLRAEPHHILAANEAGLQQESRFGDEE